MPSFKHKTNKKIILDEKSITTLDGKHKEIEKDFENDKTDKLPNLRAKKKFLSKLLENNDLSIDQQLEIKDNKKKKRKTKKEKKKKKKKI